MLLVADGAAYVGHVGTAGRTGSGRRRRAAHDRPHARRGHAQQPVARRDHPGPEPPPRGPRPERVEVDAACAGPLQVGDRFLLCSDGLAPVGLDEVARAVRGYAPQEAADWLVTLASTLGSRDNATAVVVQVAP